MKKGFVAKMGVLLAGVMLAGGVLAGCVGDTAPQDYTIQYSDDAGTHTITVTQGMPYSLDSVPYKYGYEFLGLYDAQTGGKQYVGANGASLAPYKDRENKVLFPQFKPIDYTVILDYGEAKVTGERLLTVAYDSNLPELPQNLTLEHNKFTGWYTEADGKGTQVADTYGNLPAVSVLNEENFKLDETKRVYLYAGFELEKYTVTFNFDEGMPAEEVEVPYNTPIGQVVPKTRNSEKKAGLTWSLSKDGDVFNGNVTDDLVLYVKEWAPVIELNGNGAEVLPIVARAGATISLPAPTKPLAKFLHWEDENGQEKDITTMPAQSITLNAVWQAKIEFDENGGTGVDDISKPAGESISLPTPEKEGYLFAGWYTAEKQHYNGTKMPSAGVALKAGWYRAKETTVILVKNNNSLDDCAHSSRCYYAAETCGPKADWRKEIDLSEYCDAVGNTFSITIHYDMQTNASTSIWNGGFYLYDGSIVSDANFLTKKIDSVTTNTWRTYTFSATVRMRGEILYLCYYASKTNSDGKFSYLYFNNVYVDLTYPDTTYLYL